MKKICDPAETGRLRDLKVLFDNKMIPLDILVLFIRYPVVIR